MTTSTESDRFPARPSLTPLFVCATVFWAACAVAYDTGCTRDEAESVYLAGLFAAVFAVTLLGSASAKARMACLVAASLAVGALLGGAQAATVKATAQSLVGTSATRIELEVLEDSVDYGYGENALVRCTLNGAAPAVFEARLGACGPLLAGERVIADASFKEVDFDDDRFTWQDGACGILSATVRGKEPSPLPLQVLIELRAKAIEHIGAEDDQHALLQALVCGYRRNVRGTEMYAGFQSCGLAHLVAVSGAHLVIVTGLFASLLKRLRSPRRMTIALVVIVMASYYVIAGMPVSALRASIMSALGLLSYFGKRRPSSLNAMGVGLFAIIVASPPACTSASLVLSALSTIGIVLFGPIVQAWLVRTPLSRVPFVSDALALTIAASLLSQLYACSLFNQLPLIAPIANVVTAPLFPLACGSGLLAEFAQAGLGDVAYPLLVISSVLAGLLACAVSLLSELPFASVPFTVDTAVALVVTALMGVSLWAFWPRPSARFALASVAATGSVALALLLTAGAGDRIVMLDVGQGDAILVQSRGQTLLIDTGNQDAKLLRGLAQNRIVHLDSVLITHADDDHRGSLDQLERAVDVDRIIVAGDMISCEGDAARSLVSQAGKTGRNVMGVNRGDSFHVGAFMARVVWPYTFSAQGGNADSLCILLEYDGDDDGAVDFTAFMTGDAEKDELSEMIEAGLVGDIDVLKVGHHGSRNGMTRDEVAVLAPEIALISCGKNNRYGHPTKEILTMLDEVGAATFRTDLDGPIACLFEPSGITVRRGFQ